MSDIWKPKGNKFQTEIDIELEFLFKCLFEAEEDLNTARFDLIEVEEKIKEISSNINFLKKEAKVVSLFEFNVTKSRYNRMCLGKKTYLSIIEKAKEAISMLEDREALLLDKRNKSKTIILEFSKHERKRPKNRKGS